MKRTYKVRKTSNDYFWVDECVEQDDSVDKYTVARFETEHDANEYIKAKKTMAKFKQAVKDGKIKGEVIDF